MIAVADKKDTIMQILHDLYQRYIVHKKQKWLVVEGDQKTYDILQSLTICHKEEVNKLGGDYNVKGK